MGTVNKGLLELEGVNPGRAAHPRRRRARVGGLRTSVYKTWVFLTTRYEVLSLMRHQHDYAMDLARAILSPRDTDMGEVAIAPYHHAAASAQATTIARDEASSATRALRARDGRGDGRRGRARGQGHWRGGKRHRGADDVDKSDDRWRGRGRCR